MTEHFESTQLYCSYFSSGKTLIQTQKNNRGGTLLAAAAGSGHEAVIRLFIGRDDIEPNFKDGINCLLWLATFHGHERALGDDHGLGTLTLLQVAVSEGHEAVVRLPIKPPAWM